MSTSSMFGAGFLSIYAFIIFPLICMGHVTRNTGLDRSKKFLWGCGFFVVGPLAGFPYCFLATKNRWMQGLALLAAVGLAVSLLSIGKAVDQLPF